jgi:hypothetical protein
MSAVVVQFRSPDGTPCGSGKVYIATQAPDVVDLKQAVWMEAAKNAFGPLSAGIKDASLAVHLPDAATALTDDDLLAQPFKYIVVFTTEEYEARRNAVDVPAVARKRDRLDTEISFPRGHREKNHCVAHVPRIAAEVKKHWLDNATAGQLPKLLHIFGVSGIGKTETAKDMQTVLETEYNVVKLQIVTLNSQIGSFYEDFTQKLDRNAAALAYVVNIIRQEKDADAFVLLLDECQAAPQLCRGVTAEFTNIVSSVGFAKVAIFIAFCGLASITDIGSEQVVASLSSEVIPIHLQASSTATKNIQSKYLQAATNDRRTYELLCAGNLAAASNVCMHLKASPQAALPEVCAATAAWLITRNGLVNRPLSCASVRCLVRLATARRVRMSPDNVMLIGTFGVIELSTQHDTAPVERDAGTTDAQDDEEPGNENVGESSSSLFDASPSETQVDGSSRRRQCNNVTDFVTFDPTRSTVDYTVSVGCIYLHYLFSILGRVSKIDCDPEQFEATGLHWVADRLSSMAAVFNDCFTLRHAFPTAVGSDVLLSTKLKHCEMTSQGTAKSLGGWPALETGSYQLAPPRASAADGVAVLETVVLLVQFKGVDRGVAGAPTFKSVLNEYKKAGFCGDTKCSADKCCCTYRTSTGKDHPVKAVQFADKKQIFLLITSKNMTQMVVEQIKRQLEWCLVIDDSFNVMLPHSQLWVADERRRANN